MRHKINHTNSNNHHQLVVVTTSENTFPQVRTKQAPTREEMLGDSEPEQPTPIALPRKKPRKGEKYKVQWRGLRVDSRWPEGRSITSRATCLSLKAATYSCVLAEISQKDSKASKEGDSNYNQGSRDS